MWKLRWTRYVLPTLWLRSVDRTDILVWLGILGYDGSAEPGLQICFVAFEMCFSFSHGQRTLYTTRAQLFVGVKLILYSIAEFIDFISSTEVFEK
jgi:hypothetical protein